MALSDKNIVITPNKGQTADPKIVFSGADATTANQDITLNVYPANNGTLSFEASEGQLFSLANSFSGTIFRVNDIAGIPSIEVLDTGVVKIAQYAGNVLIGQGTDNGIDKVQVNGTVAMTGIKQIQLTITPAATTILDLSSANNFYMVLNQNVIFSLTNISNNVGASGYIMMQQDATGGRTFTLSAEMKTPLGRTIAQETGSNTLSMITYYVVSPTIVVINYLGSFS